MYTTTSGAPPSRCGSMTTCCSASVSAREFSHPVRGRVRQDPDPHPGPKPAPYPGHAPVNTWIRDDVGNPLLRKGGSQTLRQTFLCLNAEGRFRHKDSSLIYILPEWLVAEAPLRFKIQKFWEGAWGVASLSKGSDLSHGMPPWLAAEPPLALDLFFVSFCGFRRPLQCNHP